MGASRDASAGGARYRRVLLKISGEALMGPGEYGLDAQTVVRVAGEIKSVLAMGVEVAVVIGGGNIFRGVSGAAKGMERASADYMGMLATVINALAMQNALEKKRVVIFAAGTGNPFFTTDTAAALRASEMGCDALLKATKVDGVYSADPKKDPTATRYDRLGYLEVLARDLGVMDASAISLARENHIPILVFSIQEPGGFADVMQGRGRCTIVSDPERS